MFARKSLSLLALVCVLLADLVAVPGPYPARGEANHPMAAAPSAPGPARLAHTSAAGSDASPVTPDAANRITLTEAGFDPAVLTVPAGTGVGWINTTAQTHILQSGVPFQVYLPLILRRTAGGAPKTASATPPALPIGTAGEGFRATLEPGGVFTHTFTTVGEFPYYLADAPHQRGRVVVTYDLDAPPLDPTVATTVCEATAFLYTGPDPLQTGVEPGTIDCQQVAVLRGRVLDRQNDPLPGVRITVLDRPEYGQTLSRADGLFDLAVNGGARLTVDYRREGYLPAQRPVEVPWNDYAWLDDVVLIPVDAQVTEVDLAQVTEPFSVAQSSVISDTDGIRRETLLIPQGTTAQLVLPGGVTQTLTTMSVHLTEYTVGENGPEAMPAPLPPNVAYTYAFELNADEELAAGAEGVAFSQPVMHYVDNFLDFPAGTIVPLGSYDGDKGVWVPEESGIVLKLVSITGGLADLDIDGDDLADDPAALAAWGITDDERAQLANLYPAGRSLWRVRIGHFSQPWDCNWGARCKNDRCDPPNAPSPGSPMVGDPCQREGSIIGCQNQTVGQALDLVGVPFGLHYDSSRVTGYKHAYTLDIPLSGPSVLDELVRIDLVVWVAGQTFKRSFPDQPNQTTSFQWDGRDVYGRLVQGPQPVTVRVGFVYEMEYVPTDRFGYSGGAIPITGSRARREMTLWKVWHGSIGTWNAGGLNVGGWSLDIYHAYVPTGRTLYLGDGRWRTAETMGPVIDTLAGVGQGGPGCYDDGIPARQACLETVQGLAIAPDGSFYESEYPYRVRRVSADGIITTVAGILGTSGFGGDGCPATQALLNDPRGLALAPDGSLYIADGNNRRVRRVSPDGIITTVVGTGGSSAFNGDGIPATQANLSSPRDLAVGPDGSLYIADSGHLRVRRVDPAGLISTVAGNGQCGPYEDGIPATAAGLCSPYGLDIGPDGSLYLTEVNNKNRIRRVGTDGIISTVAGTGASGFAGDGGPATGALLDIPRDVAVAADGALYIADTHNRRVRFVGQNGVIVTLAGGGNPPWPQNGDGGPAAQAKFGSPQTLDIAPDGSLLVSDQYSGNRVRRVSSPFAGHTGLASLVPSEDGSEVYSFDPTGRHLRTLNALTGATLLEFGYDSAALLATVTDGDGNVTRIEREADGSPTAIVGPYGQRTVLGLDANGYLASVTNPAGEAYQFSYTLDGLLTTETDPRGNEFRYTYDGRGRLAKDEDPAGGSQTLVRTEFDNGYQVAVTTALGRTTTYSVERLSNCDIRQVNTFPNGLSNQALFRPDASQVITFTDGTVVESVEGPDPRWGMLAPVCQIVTTTTPSGLESVVRVSRTAVLTDPADPLSLESLDEVTSLNGREYATHYDAATRTFTFTTPAMRQLIVTTDLRGRLVWGQADGLEPSEFSYDARGRLSSAVAGSGASSRTTTLHYGPDGILSSIVDPLDRAVYLDYDLAGRVTLRTLPGERVIGYTYDANGNLASIAPPDRPPHEFTYSGVNLLTAYIPPDVGGGNARTDYAYNADRQLTRITRPDGQVVDFSYDPAGRLASLTTPDYQTTYAYDTATGNLAIIANSRGVDLTHAYDGVLITGTAWSGSVSGTVTRTYDDDLRPAALAVTGGGSVTYQYDPDSLAFGHKCLLDEGSIMRTAHCQEV